MEPAHAPGASARPGTAYDEAYDESGSPRAHYAELGRVTHHPRTIEVSAVGGAVTLRGPVLANEADGIVREVRRVAGVDAIYDRLERHTTADIPALQGA